MTAVEPLTGRRLQAVLARAQADGQLPSVSAGVVRDGALVWHGGHGTATGGDRSPGSDLQYRIGSITKTLTAVLVLQLRDDGALALGDPLERHLPGTAYGDRTLRSLLAHDAGLPSEPPGPWWERTPGVPLPELLDRLDGTSPHDPGATHHYSNLGYALLGAVVERLRGRAWWDCVRERLLEPLGMHRTTYDATAPAARGWSVHPFAGTLTPEPAHDSVAMAPAGQLWSTVGDLARWAVFLLDGHPDVLAPSTLREMATPQAGRRETAVADGYGLGLRLLPGGERGDGGGLLVGHTGSMPGFLATLFVDPKRRTAAVALANATSGLRPDELARELLDTLEASEPSIAPAWTPVEDVPASVADVLGVWHWGNTAMTFTWDGTRVVVRSLRTGDPAYTFRPDADGRLVGASGYHDGEPLEVVRAGDGTVSHLVCATFVYSRTPYDPAVPHPGGVQETAPGGVAG